MFGDADQNAPQPVQNQTPDSPDMGGQSPLTDFNQPQDSPSSGFGGKLKAALQRFAYYGGQAGLKDAGLPTDFEIQKQKVDQELRSRQLDLQQQQENRLGSQIAYRDPQTGLVTMVPPREWARLKANENTNSTKKDISQNTLDSLESRVEDTNSSKEKIAAGNNATKLKAEEIKGNFGLRRAAINASNSGGSDPEDYLDAVNTGMPINMVPAKVRGKVLALAKSSGMNVTFAKLSPDAQKMVNSISELQPVIETGLKALESHKGENSLADRGKAAIEGGKYALGIATDDPLYQQINKVGNLVKVLGATPYTTVGRGKYLFDEIQKHLPRPGIDTPKLMYEKMNTLNGLLEQMEQSVTEGQFKGTAGMGGQRPKSDAIIEDGYMFVGGPNGNKADPKNWKKVGK